VDDARAQSTLGLSVSTNQTTYHVGDTLTASVSVNNPGIPENADFFFGIQLPDGTIQTFTDLSFNSVTCSLANLAACRPIAPDVSLAAPFSFDQPAFLTHGWTGSDALGNYTLFAAAIVPGALAHNTVAPGDVIALSTWNLTGASGTCPQVSATYTMSLTSFTQNCASIFGISGPATCTVSQAGCSVTFNCAPPVVGFGTMVMDATGVAPFSFAQSAGQVTTCTVNFDTSSTPLKYHAFCVVPHGGQGSGGNSPRCGPGGAFCPPRGQSDNCDFDGTQ
jgi:hypothetical protein